MAINKVIYGNNTLIDLTGDTVTSSTMLVGGIAHNAAGEQIQGGLVKVPEFTTSFTWDGTAKTPITTYDSDHINISGTTTATNAGKYTFTMSLSDNNYVWSDGTTANKVITWYINAKIVTWSSGTDDEVRQMLKAHYAGLIDIHDYWTIGDERTVSLSAMAASYADEIHNAQDVTMVLMNVGGKTLNPSINGRTKCAFIVGQKNVLYDRSGHMNSSTYGGGWASARRRSWCNNTYKGAIPSTLRDIFKQFVNVTANGNGSTTSNTNDYFALPSEKEVFGTVTYANATAEENNSMFQYYAISSNRIKYSGDNSSTTRSWWERSPRNGDSNNYYCRVLESGSASYSHPTNSHYLAPFGVI